MLGMIYVATGLRVVSAVMLLYLASIYWKNYMKMKSGFTAGLLFFSVFLLVQNVFAIYFRILSGADYGDEISVHNTILNMLLVAGIASLVYATKR